MKYIKLIIFLCSFYGFAQQAVETSLLKKTRLNAQTLVSIDDFETLFTIQNNNELFKIEKDKVVATYSNIQLGKISSVNTFNPLKINLFYTNFNTIIILDNRLSEMFKINFNNIQPFKNISHISTGSDNSLWLFNQNTQELEIYDYKINKTKFKTLPVQGPVLDLISNYNFCWLLTKNYIYTYNYVGSLLSKIKNDGFTKFIQTKGNVLLQKENKLFYLAKDSQNFKAITIPKLLINQFFVTNETLYIYDTKFIYQYRLKIN